ncbi:MAG: type II toxin-antitoxin system MqsA family antitoxin [Candidatus Brocadia sp.]|nr:type II toxin-antitoxin system MqsA family antitoxin [Candidatus Brocadia sp.]
MLLLKTNFVTLNTVLNNMNTCSVCHGKTIQKYITYTQWYQGELVAVEHVPAEVCENCNEEYFSPETVDKLQNTIDNQFIA